MEEVVAAIEAVDSVALGGRDIDRWSPKTTDRWLQQNSKGHDMQDARCTSEVEAELLNGFSVEQIAVSPVMVTLRHDNCRACRNKSTFFYCRAIVGFCRQCKRWV